MRLARDQALILHMNKVDSSGENHGLNPFFTLIFLKGACLFMIERNIFVKK